MGEIGPGCCEGDDLGAVREIGAGCCGGDTCDEEPSQLTNIHIEMY